MTTGELFKLDDKLRVEIEYDTYHKEIEKAATVEECNNIVYGFSVCGWQRCHPLFLFKEIFQHDAIGRSSADEVGGSRGLGPLHQQAQVASGGLCTHRCHACKYLTSAGKERFFETGVRENIEKMR